MLVNPIFLVWTPWCFSRVQKVSNLIIWEIQFSGKYSFLGNTVYRNKEIWFAQSDGTTSSGFQDYSRNVKFPILHKRKLKHLLSEVISMLHKMGTKYSVKEVSTCQYCISYQHCHFPFRPEIALSVLNQTVPVKGKSKKSLAGIYFLVFWQNKKSVCFHLVGSHSLLRLQSPLEGLS